MDSTKRDTGVDVLKGIAIILVVIGHIRTYQPVVNFIYTFHMPLFAFLSGCTFWMSLQRRVPELRDGRGIASYIGRRFVSLMVPYFVWTILLIFSGRVGGNTTEAISEGFDELWFLPTMFGLVLICALAFLTTSTIEHRRGGTFLFQFFVEAACLSLLGVLTAALYLVTSVKVFREILIYAIPFYMGVAVKRYHMFRRVFMHQVTTTVCLLVFVLLEPLYDVSDKSLSVLVVRFITGIAFTQVLYVFINAKCDRGPGRCEGLVRALSFFGANSLSIYIIHPFFQPLFTKTILIGAFQDTILRVLYSVVICAVSILISEVIGQSGSLNMLLFGKLPGRQKRT